MGLKNASQMKLKIYFLFLFLVSNTPAFSVAPREIYTKDVLTTDLIKNLTISSDVDDQYHKRYVNKLKEVNNI